MVFKMFFVWSSLQSGGLREIPPPLPLLFPPKTATTEAMSDINLYIWTKMYFAKNVCFDSYSIKRI